MDRVKTLRLKDKHGWKAKPGYCVCVDLKKNHEYCARLCIGRGSTYCLITFDFWADQAGQFEH